MRHRGIRKKFEWSEIRVNTPKFVRYYKGENRNLVINEERTKIVRRIFLDFLQGETPEKYSKNSERRKGSKLK